MIAAWTIGWAPIEQAMFDWRAPAHTAAAYDLLSRARLEVVERPQRSRLSFTFGFELEAIEPVVHERAKHDWSLDAAELVGSEIDDGVGRTWQLIEQPSCGAEADRRVLSTGENQARTMERMARLRSAAAPLCT